jgi:hypothetical protein
MAVGSVGVLMTLFAVLLGRSSVLLGLGMLPDIVMMGGLVVVVRSGVMLGSRLVVMIAGRMLRCLGHL